jgi:alpha-1,3-glucan synthase
MLDRFADGDPTNNAYFNTPYEHDPLQVNFHHGGDVAGLIRKLDYLEHLGVKGIYLAGTPFLNQPWDYHQYNPIDLTILDPHRGTIEDWRRFTDAVHQRGMVIMIDLTIETLGDLTYFQGYLNQSAPLNLNGYDMIYRTNRTYLDFELTNQKSADCDWPQFYDGITGLPVRVQVPPDCYVDDFVHYGDLEAFGNFKAWERQLTKFSGVQDRVRDWSPEVAERLVRLSCLAIEGLDIDAIRVDKATQMTLDFATKVWASGTRECAARIGKQNFFIPGEITSGISLASMYMGKGRFSIRKPESVFEGTTGDLDRFSVREEYGLDSEAFHYSFYRSFLAFVGLEGSILVEGDPGSDIIEAWNMFLIAVDYRNAYSGELDPRDMFAINNQDTFRWFSLEQGLEKHKLGLFLTSIVLPNGPALYYGEEQGLYLHDSRSENYIYGRQPMTTALAWQLHGCFRGNASYQFTNIRFSSKSRNGCLDDSQSMDHFDPVSSDFLFVQHLYHLRVLYPILQEGFGLETLSKIPVGNGRYIWSVRKTYLPVQLPAAEQTVWFLFTNSNTTETVSGCGLESLIRSPFAVETIVSDLFEDLPDLVVQESSSAVPCVGSLTLEPYGFRAYVAQAEIVPMPPRLIALQPGHDSRIDILQGTTINMELRFSDLMDCDTIDAGLSVISFPIADVQWTPGTCQAEGDETIWSTQVSGIQEGVMEWKLSNQALSMAGEPILV